MEQRQRRGQYLDVSQYILVEFSPISKAMSGEMRITQRNYHDKHLTPEIAPIDHDTSTLNITPFLNGLIEIADQHLDEFFLEADCTLTLELRPKDRNHTHNTRSRRNNDSLLIFHVDNLLEDIIEESDCQINSYDQSNSHDFEFEEEDFEEAFSEGQEQKDEEPDQSQFKIQQEYQEKMDRYLKDPKHTLVKEIRKIVQTKEQGSEEMKLELIRKAILSYIVDFEVPCFEQAWKDLNLPLKEKAQIVLQGIEECFDKKIGNLSFPCRRMKLLKYLQKKRMRKWRKKVSYDCRKKVADSRLRIKGKFVTRKQVCSQLGITNLQIYTGDEIRELLERKMQESKEKSESG